MTEWTCRSSDALTLSFVRAQADEELLLEDEDYTEFHPSFTYPIYGDKETIYGYRDLVIDLRFASGSLAYYLNVDYSKKLSAAKAADDVEGILYKFIPSDYLKKEKDFMDRVEADALSFKPLGEKVYSYSRRLGVKGSKGKSKAQVDEVLNEDDEDVVTFEVYHVTMSTPGFREYNRRMQLFILLYIEGGSYLDEEDDSWEFTLLYEKRRRRDADRTATYHFMGYSSLYPFLHYPDRIKMRISQFVILPPYQHQGHGSELYNAIYKYVMSEDRIAELSVEDPAEAFEDLRDRNDLRILLRHDDFMREAFGADPATGEKHKGLGKGKLGPPAEKGWVEKWRINLKMASRQFQRLMEMLVLQCLNPSDSRFMRAYRLQVKERIYRFNFETLVQLEKQERLEKLEETFQIQIEDYQRILDMIS